MRKNLVKDFVALVAGSMALASLTGALTVVNQHDLLSYVFTWTGGNTTNGSIGIDASLDGLTWFPLDFEQTISVDGATGSHQLLVNKVGFNYTRPTYTRVNGAATGSLTVELFCSNVGA